MNAIYESDKLYEMLVRMTREERQDACKYPEFREACRKLGKDVYDSDKLLGAGSFGDVFLADNRGKKYAFKKFNKFQDDVFKEISTIALMSLIEAKHAMSTGNFKFGKEIGYVMPLATDSLRGWIRKNVEYCKGVQKDIITQMSEGVQDLHSVDVLHLDIKPDNYLVFIEGSNFTIKLGDFGLATPFPLQIGEFAYTLPYRSGGARLNVVDRKSDLWALGVSCLEVLNDGEWLVDVTKPLNFPLYIQTIIQKMKAIDDSQIRRHVRECISGTLDEPETVTVERDWSTQMPLEDGKDAIKLLEATCKHYGYATHTLALSIDIFCRAIHVGDFGLHNTTLAMICLHLATQLTELEIYEAKKINSKIRDEKRLEVLRALNGLLWLPGLDAHVFEGVTDLYEIWTPDYDAFMTTVRDLNAYAVK